MQKVIIEMTRLFIASKDLYLQRFSTILKLDCKLSVLNGLNKCSDNFCFEHYWIGAILSFEYHTIAVRILRAKPQKFVQLLQRFIRSFVMTFSEVSIKQSRLRFLLTFIQKLFQVGITSNTSCDNVSRNLSGFWGLLFLQQF